MPVISLVCLDLAQAANAVCDAYLIRPFSPADADGVAELVAAAGDSGPNPRPSGLIAELRSRPARSVSCWLARPRTAPTEANFAATPCGLVTLVQSKDRAGGERWSIGWLLVHPDARRQGVGRGLVATAVGTAVSAGAHEVWTETSAAWPAAAFWRAVGFVPAAGAG